MIAKNLNLIKDSARIAISRLHSDEKGQGMTEYVIILVAIVVAVATAGVSAAATCHLQHGKQQW